MKGKNWKNIEHFNIVLKTGHGFGTGKGLNDETVGGSAKQYGLGKIVFNQNYVCCLFTIDGKSL